MMLVTHFSLPVIAAVVLDTFIERRSGRHVFSTWGYLLVGYCGVLPDMLHPHVYLRERFDSWSHGVLGVAAFSALCVVLHVCIRFTFRKYVPHSAVPVMCVAAYVVHVVCDAISGGVKPLYPYSDYICGTNWVPHTQWVLLDITFVFFTLVLFYVTKQRTACLTTTK